MQEPNPLTAEGAGRWTDDVGAARRGGRRVFDAVSGTVAALHAPSAIALADALGRAACRLRLHGPRPDEVQALFPDLSDDRAEALARRIAALRLKNRTAIALVESGRTVDLAALVRWAPDSDPARLLSPVGARLVVAAHVGAFFGIRAALHGASRPVLMVRDQPLAAPAARARALKQAVDHVRAGGLVVSTIDGPGGTSSREVECLGRRIVLRRGPLAVARLAGVPMVPVVCEWTEAHRIEVRIEPPIGPCDPRDPDAEGALAAAAAGWLDTYLRRRPHQLWLSTLRHYLAAPLGRTDAGVPATS